MRFRSAYFVALGFVGVLAAGCSDTTLTPPPDPAIPPEVAASAAQWPLPGRDYRNSRATKDTRIARATIAALAPAWDAQLPGPGSYGNASTVPLILGDTVYVEDLSSNVHAIDFATGAFRWHRNYNGFAIGPNGVAVGWGKVFAIKNTSDVVALDSATGDELWDRSIIDTPTAGVDIQPTVYANLVFASSVPISIGGIYVGGDRGVLRALDQETGSVAWLFNTVTDDFWGNPSVNSGGGAWYPPAIDTQSGRMFWGIANPAPFPGVPGFPNGTSRPGPNLYTDCTVSLDARTGELQWYQQAVQHDLFDRDLVHALLVDATIAGRERTIAVGTGKLGRVAGHDLATGAVLWDTSVGKHMNDELTSLPGTTTVLPGSFGGVITPPAAADGVVYVAVINAPSTYQPDQPGYFGSDFGTMPGEMVAIDAASGAILWDVEVDGDPFGGATVVNDLVLTATFQGQLFAFDRATGEKVWSYTAPGGVNGWPAVSGDTIVWPIGLSKPAELLALRLPPA